MAQEDIALENDGVLHLRATSRVSKAFAELNLFVGYQLDMPANPSALVRIPKNISFETYTSSLGHLFAAGAFTYSETPVTEVKAGRYCSIAHSVSTMGERHPIEEVTSSSFTYCYLPNYRKPQFVRAHEQLLGNAFPAKPPAGRFAPLPVLKHDVWVGQQVILARGITLHTGCVVGAGSVVTKDVPPYTIVAGNPARAIRKRFSAELCQRLLATQWWNYHPKVLFEFERAEPVRFVMQMEAALAEGSLEPLPVQSLTWKDVLAKINEL